MPVPGRLRAPARRHGARKDPPLRLHRRARLRHPRRHAAFRVRRRRGCERLQLAGLETGVPVAFGVLTCDSRRQAEERAAGRRGTRAPRQRSGARDGRPAHAPSRPQPSHKPLAAILASVLPGRLCRRSAQSAGKLPRSEQQEPLDGGNEAAVQPEPPARPHSRERVPRRTYVCARCLKAGKVQKAL